MGFLTFMKKGSFFLPRVMLAQTMATAIVAIIVLCLRGVKLVTPCFAEALQCKPCVQSL